MSNSSRGYAARCTYAFHPIEVINSSAFVPALGVFGQNKVTVVLTHVNHCINILFNQ
jgi:hypothetical protein